MDQTPPVPLGAIYGLFFRIGLFSFGGFLEGVRVCERLPLIRLGPRTKSKNSKLFAISWSECITSFCHDLQGLKTPEAQAVPPTVKPSMRKVGCPTPTGTL